MSYSSSSYSASVSGGNCLPIWAENVCKDGSLFYAQYLNKSAQLCTSFLPSNKKINRNCKCKNAETPLSLSSCVDNLNKNQHELTFRKCQHCKVVDSGSEKCSEEVIEISILIHPENGIQIAAGTICESLLGFSTQPFSDGIRLMVNEYKKNSFLYQKRSITTGDWFKSINEYEINSYNIDKVLLKFKKPSVVSLKFKRIFEEKIDLDETKIKQIPNFETFINLAQHLFESTIEEVHEGDIIFSVVIVPISFICDEHTSNEAIFSYPEKNNIFNIRGCFSTLYSILKTQLAVEPINTTIHIGNIDYFVSYICEGNVLLLISISSSFLTAKEAQLKTYDIVQYFKSSYQIFDKKVDLQMKTHLYKMCKIIDIYLRQNKNIYLFEKILQQSHIIDLPQKAQQEIFEALNEMGAMDYRDWNDTPLNSHREFFICGCALYFYSYLLNSQLLATHLSKIESFLRCSGAFDFIKNHTINDFIYWRELPIENEKRRNFLLICTRNHLTLAVLLQEHDSDGLLNENTICDEKLREPPLFYIEEIQETLEHLGNGAIENLANVWTTSCKLPYKNESFLSTENSSHSPISETPILRNSFSDVRMSTRESVQTNATHFETPKNYESDSDWDGFSNNNKKSDFCITSYKTNVGKKISDNIPVDICIGEKNVLIYYVQINFESGLLIAPPNDDLSGVLIQEFKSVCHLIHTVFQNTKRKSKTSKSNCKTLALVREHAILIDFTDINGIKQEFWAIGKLFTSPHCELYVCQRSEGSLNLEEIAFRLSFGTFR